MLPEEDEPPIPDPEAFETTEVGSRGAIKRYLDMLPPGPEPDTIPGAC